MHLQKSKVTLQKNEVSITCFILWFLCVILRDKYRAYKSLLVSFGLLNIQQIR